MPQYNYPTLTITTGAQSPEKIKERLAVIDQVIDNLEAAMVLATTGGDSTGIVEYEIHTGATKQKVRHTEPEQFIQALEKWQRYRDYLASKLTPRRVRLVKGRSFGKSW